MKKLFFWDDYRRTLRHKYRELIFRKANILSTLLDEPTKIVRELFDIEEPETISSIAINHIVSNLEKHMSQDAKIFQLTGNKSLENL